MNKLFDPSVRQQSPSFHAAHDATCENFQREETLNSHSLNKLQIIVNPIATPRRGNILEVIKRGAQNVISQSASLVT